MPSPVRLAFVDFPGPFNPVRIEALLRRRFDVELSNEPDYLIYSCFGHEHLNYPNAVRIFFTGENVRPDFNLCDYAFGYDWMEFGDRNHRCPNYQLYEHYHELIRRGRSHPKPPPDRRFCNFVYTNGDAHPFRDAFFRLLSTYRKVDSAGAHLNNVGFSPGQAYAGDWPGEKVEYQRQFKFSIAFENSSTIGYTTEKIVHALAADTVPIYWGNPEVGREFNEERFVNVHRFATPEDALRAIMRLDSDQRAYERVLAAPFFPGGQVSPRLTDDAILDKFAEIFDQPLAAAFRRNTHVWGRIYEERRKREVAAAEAAYGPSTAWRKP